MSNADSASQKKKGLAKLAKARSISSSLNDLDVDPSLNDPINVLVDPGSSTLPSVLLTSANSIPSSQGTSNEEATQPQTTSDISLTDPGYSNPVVEINDDSTTSNIQSTSSVQSRYIKRDSSLSSVESESNKEEVNKEEKPQVSRGSPKKSFLQSFNRKSTKKKKEKEEKKENKDDKNSRSSSPCRLELPKPVTRSRSLSRLSDAISNVQQVCMTPTKSAFENKGKNHLPRASPNSLMVASQSLVSSSFSTSCPNPNKQSSSKDNARPQRTTHKSPRLKNRIAPVHIVSVDGSYKSGNRNSSQARSYIETIVENQVSSCFSPSECTNNLPLNHFTKSKVKTKSKWKKRPKENYHKELTDSSSCSSQSMDTSDYGSKMNGSCNASPTNVTTSMHLCLNNESKGNGGIHFRSSPVAVERTGKPAKWNTIDRSSIDYDSCDFDYQMQDTEDFEEGDLTSRRWSSLGRLEGESTGIPTSQMKISEAKQKNYLFGGLGSLLGPSELKRYFPDRNVVILIATWNMNGKEPPGSLDDFLLPDDLEHMPDMFVIGTQESGGDRNEWEVRLQTTIGPTHVLFHSAVLGILHLTVFLRRDLIWFCSVPEEGYYSLRPGTYFKTKGAIAISFQFFGTRMLFINTHLFAHEEKQSQRIQNYKQIINNIDLPRNLKSRSMVKPKDVTNRYDIVFWMGDLNFRLVGPREDILKMITESSSPKGNYYIRDLLYFDQLNQAKNKGEIFQGFSEGTIDFAPTFKFDVGTNHYDTSSKQRVPSYTDRILYKSTRDPIKCTNYGSCPPFKTSDHKPVWGVYEFKVRPGKDDVPLAAGMFNREIYLTGLKRRRKLFHQPSSKNCQTQ